MFRRCAYILLGLFLLSGCRRSVSLEPYRPASAHRHGNAQEAIKRCLEALDGVWSRPASEQFASVFETCADLYVEPLCHHRLRTLARVSPERRAVALAESCKIAYCDRLPAPNPRLCAHYPAALSDDELRQQWKEFNARVYRWDLGDDDPLEGSAFRYLEAGPQQLDAPPIAPAPSPVKVSLKQNGEGFEIKAEGPGVSTATKQLHAAFSAQDVERWLEEDLALSRRTPLEFVADEKGQGLSRLLRGASEAGFARFSILR